jgi:hypothetical protein
MAMDLGNGPQRCACQYREGRVIGLCGAHVEYMREAADSQTPAVDAILKLDVALSRNEGSSETQIKLALPAYYDLWQQMRKQNRWPENAPIPNFMTVGRIKVIPAL